MDDVDNAFWHSALYKGPTTTFEARSLDELGECVTKARIIRGWSQSELAAHLSKKPQQIQRYEQGGWQKIDMWRLQEVMETLGLEMSLLITLPKGAGVGEEE